MRKRSQFRILFPLVFRVGLFLLLVQIDLFVVLVRFLIVDIFGRASSAGGSSSSYGGRPQTHRPAREPVRQSLFPLSRPVFPPSLSRSSFPDSFSPWSPFPAKPVLLFPLFVSAQAFPLLLFPPFFPFPVSERVLRPLPLPPFFPPPVSGQRGLRPSSSQFSFPQTVWERVHPLSPLPLSPSFPFPVSERAHPLSSSALPPSFPQVVSMQRASRSLLLVFSPRKFPLPIFSAFSPPLSFRVRQRSSFQEPRPRAGRGKPSFSHPSSELLSGRGFCSGGPLLPRSFSRAFPRRSFSSISFPSVTISFPNDPVFCRSFFLSTRLSRPL